MEQSVGISKKAVRAEVKRRMEMLTPQQRAAKSRLILERFLALPEFASAEVAMLYVALPDEIDMSLFLEAALRAGRVVAVPKCVEKMRWLIPCRLRDPATELAPGLYGIMEPVRVEPVAVEAIDLVAVPGRAFDHRGHRLGRGAGYYDRFVARPGFRATLCGLAFSEQVLPEVPHEPFDLHVSILVTDQDTFRCQGPSSLGGACPGQHS